MKTLKMTLLLLVVGSCATGENMAKVEPGMTMNQVKRLVGKPDSFHMAGDGAVYKYNNRMVSGWGWNRADYEVHFNSEGLVIGAGDSTSAYNRGLYNAHTEQRLNNFRKASEGFNNTALQMQATSSRSVATDNSQEGYSRCTTNSLNQNICSKYIGGVAINIGVSIVCGKGMCVKNAIGHSCSKIPGGTAAVASIGVECSGGCESPSSNNCESLKSF